MKEVNIEVKDYVWDCGDGCCTNYGTIVIVDGQELKIHTQDIEIILQSVLEHLGYKPTVKTIFDDE